MVDESHGRPTVDLQAHLEFKISSLEEKWKIRADLGDKALDLAKGIADTQREQSNYVRDQLREQASSFVGREPFDLRCNGIDQRADRQMERIVTIEKLVANFQGRMWALGLGLGVFFTALQFGLKLMGK